MFSDNQSVIIPSFRESAERSSFSHDRGTTPPGETSSFASLYPDTMPHSAWKDHVAAWVRRNEHTVSKPIQRRRTSSPATPYTRVSSQNDDSWRRHSESRPFDPVRSIAYSSSPFAPVQSSTFLLFEQADAASKSLTVPTTLPSPPASPKTSSIEPEPVKVCISCKSSQSPCWRPSWCASAGQLCNSCGLRYKKTGARCLNSSCGKIPSKGEWSTMNKRVQVGPDGEARYTCLQCDGPVELRLKP